METTTSIIDGVTRGAYVPRPEQSEVAIGAPGHEAGYWVGAAGAWWHDGSVYLAYRQRQPVHLGRGQGVVVAKSSDGVHFHEIARIGKEDMDAESLERPAIVRTEEGKWRLYLSCATTGTKHWRVEMLEADDPRKFSYKTRQTILPGDEHWGVKDPVIVRHDSLWHMWATFHPLDERGQEDRMETRYASSLDGIQWDWAGQALRGRDGLWDSRGARVSAVVFEKDRVVALYDGRASAEENYEERTGIAIGSEPGSLRCVGDRAIAQSGEGKGLRYAVIVDLPGHLRRWYYELTLPDGSHELRTEVRQLKR